MADTKLISWKVSDFANSDGTWRSELYGFKYYKKEGIRGYIVNSNSRISLSAGKILFEESRFTVNTTDPNTQDTIAYENKYFYREIVLRTNEAGKNPRLSMV